MINEKAADSLIESCRSDGEFCLASRHWTGSLRLEAPSGVCAIRFDDGIVRPTPDSSITKDTIALRASDTTWAKLLALKPPRLHNDISVLIARQEMTLQADPVCYAQYYPAVMRAIELLRRRTGMPTRYMDYPEAIRAFEPALASMPAVTPPQAAKPSGTFDSPVGRYVHLEIENQDYRIYFEEAGSGIPMLLQHTAGAHGAQWRHLFECREITDHFRLIAYDLPFHGKSLPPVGPKWWAEEYRLTASFARALPVTLARTLGLHRPVFMGCSVGGLLALDLARHHPDLFSAVISLEGALKIEAAISDLGRLWHPQVSNEYKGRLMNGLMSPTSPEAYRKETSQVYASGWPPAFLGDLHYYVADYDLREEASKIDTNRVAVHILSGEYDPSGTMERGQAAQAAIAGSTWAGMTDVGHFPMSENPEAFLVYLLPILEQVRRRQGS
jgi:pimeloyl-ACP methyl ester carboxylesterase